MPSVKKYKITPLAFDPELAEQVARLRTDGKKLVDVAATLKITNGKAAMAEMWATLERVDLTDDPAKLARAITKDRRAGRSWGWLAARYGVNEKTARAAYEAASGESYSALDFRKKAEVA